MEKSGPVIRPRPPPFLLQWARWGRGRPSLAGLSHVGEQAGGKFQLGTRRIVWVLVQLTHVPCSPQVSRDGGTSRRCQPLPATEAKREATAAWAGMRRQDSTARMRPGCLQSPRKELEAGPQVTQPEMAQMAASWDRADSRPAHVAPAIAAPTCSSGNAWTLASRGARSVWRPLGQLQCPPQPQPTHII